MESSRYFPSFKKLRWYIFDRYFRLTVSDEELSQSLVQRLLRARGDMENLRSELENLHSRGLLNAGIEELGVYQDQIEPHQVEPFITGLFDVADALSDDERGMFEVPAHWRIGSLVLKAIEKVNDSETRVAVVKNAITKNYWQRLRRSERWRPERDEAPLLHNGLPVLTNS
jgi:hypothetical protein